MTIVFISLTRWYAVFSPVIYPAYWQVNICVDFQQNPIWNKILKRLVETKINLYKYLSFSFTVKFAAVCQWMLIQLSKGNRSARDPIRCKTWIKGFRAFYKQWLVNTCSLYYNLLLTWAWFYCRCISNVSLILLSMYIQNYGIWFIAKTKYLNKVFWPFL